MNKNLWILLAVVIGVIAFIASSQDDDKKAETARLAELSAASQAAAEPPSVAKASRNIEHIILEEKTLKIDAYFGDTLLDEADMVVETSMLATSVGKAIKAGAADAGDAKTVEINIYGNTIDRLGNESKTLNLRFILPADDLRAANYTNLSYAEVLDLSVRPRIFNMAGKQAMIDWCAKKADLANHICSAY